MNATFHALTGFGISHLAARSLDGAATNAFVRRDLPVLASAFVIGVLSHGVLDGLKHGYPIPAVVDAPVALALGMAWCAAVKARYRLLFAVVFVAVMLPDLIDLGPAISDRLLGWHLTSFRRLFPWHWIDGSGSLYGALDAGDNQVVSITNHGIVLFLSGVAVVSNRAAFRTRASRA